MTPMPPPLDGDKSLMAKARRQLLAFRDDKDHPFPKHVVPRDFADIVEEHGARSVLRSAQEAKAAASSGGRVSSRHECGGRPSGREQRVRALLRRAASSSDSAAGGRRAAAATGV